MERRDMKQLDVIILGCGAVGSAAAYAASKQGLEVLCIEQFGPCHDKGSSHGETRIFRKAYFDNPEYIPLLHAAYDGWKDLEAKSGKRLFVDEGLLVIGEQDQSFLKTMQDISQQHQLQTDYLSANDIKQRFPMFEVMDNMSGVYEPQGGYLLPEAIIETHIDLAKQAGGQFNFNEKVLSYQLEDSGQFLIKTDKNTFQSEKLIIAAGAWSKGGINALDNESNGVALPVEIILKSLLWYQVGKLSAESMPCFAYELGDDFFYGFPVINNLIKVARHSGGQLIQNPEAKDDLENLEEEKAIKYFFDAYLHFGEKPLQLAKQAHCMYTNTQDKNFIVDYHPASKQCAFAAGLSGHGFKMSNVLGECLVKMVCGDEIEAGVRPFTGLTP